MNKRIFQTFLLALLVASVDLALVAQENQKSFKKSLSSRQGRKFKKPKPKVKANKIQSSNSSTQTNKSTQFNGNAFSSQMKLNGISQNQQNAIGQKGKLGLSQFLKRKKRLKIFKGPITKPQPGPGPIVADSFSVNSISLIRALDKPSNILNIQNTKTNDIYHTEFSLNLLSPQVGSKNETDTQDKSSSTQKVPQISPQVRAMFVENLEERINTRLISTIVEKLKSPQLQQNQEALFAYKSE